MATLRKRELNDNVTGLGLDWARGRLPSEQTVTLGMKDEQEAAKPRRKQPT